MFRSIRYLGNKKKLLRHISSVLTLCGVRPGRALDAFAGSGRVSWALRQAGHEVVAVDTLRTCTALASLALSFHEHPAFAGLTNELGIEVRAGDRTAGATALLDHLSTLPPRASFVMREYSPGPHAVLKRRYFTVDNAMRIDAIRETIRDYREAELIDVAEHEYLLATLIVAAGERANTSGQMSAFLREFQSGARRSLNLRLPDHLPAYLLPLGSTIQRDAAAAAATAGPFELVYVGPPYNERRHDSYYHVMERIAEGWFGEEEPVCTGVTGQRLIRAIRSPWNGRATAPAAMDHLLESVDARHLLMSYSSEGVIHPDQIANALRERGVPESYRQYPILHPRYFAGRGVGAEKVIESLHYIGLS